MITIKYIFWCKKHAKLLVLIAIVFVLAAEAVAIFCVSNANSLDSAYTIITGWHNEKGQYFKVGNTQLTKPVTIYATTPQHIAYHNNFVIYSKGANILVSTKGKEIYRLDNASRHPTYTIINGEDIPTNTEIAIHFTPTGNGKAYIISPIILTSTYDLILSQISNNLFTLSVAASLFIASIALGAIAVYKYIKGLRKAFFLSYSSVIMLLLSAAITTSTKIPQLLGANTTGCKIMQWTALLLAILCCAIVFLQLLKNSVDFNA